MLSCPQTPILLKTLITELPGDPVRLRLHAANAGGMSLISSWGTKIPHAA